MKLFQRRLRKKFKGPLPWRGDVDSKDRRVDITTTSAFGNRDARQCWLEHVGNYPKFPATDYIFSHGVFNHQLEHHTVPYQPIYDVLVGFSLTAYLFQLLFEQAHPLKLHFRGLPQVKNFTSTIHDLVVVGFIGALSLEGFNLFNHLLLRV